MTYTISGKHYTEFDINKRCADFIPVAIDKNQDAAVKSKSSSVLVNNFEYNPCNNPLDTWPVIDKCWGRLLEMVNDCGLIDYADFCVCNKWQYIINKHNCTKLVAACICLIEINEGKL